MRTIVLADGTTYNCEWCSNMDGLLDMNLYTDASVIELVAAFGDPDKTARIELRYGDVVKVYEGYTVLRTLSVAGWKPDTTLIIMGRETNG